MGRDDDDLRAAKVGYREAVREGNREEEARWANVVGDIYKTRGEYVKALEWLRKDYDVSIKFLPQKQLLPTCQSLGELFLRLDQHEEALVYQKKHLDLAKESNDLIEQQRASTQLGRTYHEMFIKSENDHSAVRNAKKYFKSAMKLARSIKENPPCNTFSFFLKEFIDAHNNIGMLEMDLDNLDEAERILLQGLKICNDEEVNEDDDGRSRLHHNLGSLYIERREWGKARQNIERDILICKRIGHPQGEAKGFINLGELHYRVQKYDDAIICYQKALDIAKSMEDEDALVDQVSHNIKTMKEAAKVMDELKKDEQKFKKLMRTTCEARGESNERKCLLEQSACLDCLIEKSSVIFAWPKHLEFAKKKKRVAKELCDKEKLSDSFLAIGESYQKLRKSSKAKKWYMKGWNVYRSIGNLEGQALTKINIGEVLDSSGDWAGALEAFEEGYRIALQGNLPEVQISALENMHYSHMIRFDNSDEARKLQTEINSLKHLQNKDTAGDMDNGHCSETETEGGGVSDNVQSACGSPEVNKPASSSPNATDDEFDANVPLASLISQTKRQSKIKMLHLDNHGNKADKSSSFGIGSTKDLTNSHDNQQSVSRKRVRVVISDDEADAAERMDRSTSRIYGSHKDGVASYDKDIEQEETIGTNEVEQDISHPSSSKDVLSASTPIHIEESSCSFKSKSPKFSADNGVDFGFRGEAGIAKASIGSKLDIGNVAGILLQAQNGVVFNLPGDNNSHCMTFKIGHDLAHVNINSYINGGDIDIEYLKVEVACGYYLQLYKAKLSKGLLPVIGHLEYCGKVLDSLVTIGEIEKLVSGEAWIEVVINGWVPKRLMNLYIEHCEKLSEAPNMRLLKRLYNLEVSEDEVIVSDCGLQDISISPFLNALQSHKTVALLDVSHNLLGNETMEKLQQIFISSNQKYGGLTLDLHCNRFGPTALFQICECPIMFARLEVLNLCENRLTDACSSYLSNILENCKGLYSLNIEQCSITSRTIQKIADALHEGSVLSHLSIGKNNPISSNVMVNLLAKLASLGRFLELSLTGIRLSKPMVDGLCQLARSSTLSGLLLGGTYIGMDGAMRLTEALSSGSQELVKLYLSYCGLRAHDFTRLLANVALVSSVQELNFEGNSIGEQGCDALGSILADPQCTLKYVNVNKCHLGLAGILRIVQALQGNDTLEELHLAENADIANERTLEYEPTSRVDEECNKMEVADSEEEEEATKEEALLCPEGTCASSSKRNMLAGTQLTQELSSAIGSAKQLQLLDLSRNGFSMEVIDIFYSSWASSCMRCGGSPYKHVMKEQMVVHFSVDGKRCCGIKPCCRRD